MSSGLGDAIVKGVMQLVIAVAIVSVVATLVVGGAVYGLGRLCGWW